MSVAAAAGRRPEEERARARRLRPLHRAGRRPTSMRPCAPPSPPACRTTGSRASPPSASSWSTRWPTSSSPASPRRWTRWSWAIPFDPATDVGPIVTEAQRDELVSQVEEAVPQGATVHAGARRPDGDGWWFAPDRPLRRHHGHAGGAGGDLRPGGASCSGCPTSIAAIAAANATTFGLGSSVWTQRRGRDARAASRRSRPARCSSTPWWRRRPSCPSAGSSVGLRP